MWITCVTNVATARASVRMQVHRTKINSHYLLLKQIWQTNDGFAVINPETKECKVRLLGQISDCKADDANDKLYEGLRRLICAVIDDYSYLIMK
jgi:hypothetical protein